MIEQNLAKSPKLDQCCTILCWPFLLFLLNCFHMNASMCESWQRAVNRQPRSYANNSQRWALSSTSLFFSRFFKYYQISTKNVINGNARWTVKLVPVRITRRAGTPSRIFPFFNVNQKCQLLETTRVYRTFPLHYHFSISLALTEALPIIHKHFLEANVF